jgi:hypothetical protein
MRIEWYRRAFGGSDRDKSRLIAPKRATAYPRRSAGLVSALSEIHLARSSTSIVSERAYEMFKQAPGFIKAASKKRAATSGLWLR